MNEIANPFAPICNEIYSIINDDVTNFDEKMYETRILNNVLSKVTNDVFDKAVEDMLPKMINDTYNEKVEDVKTGIENILALLSIQSTMLKSLEKHMEDISDKFIKIIHKYEGT